jgi:hypothetical protein
MHLSRALTDLFVFLVAACGGTPLPAPLRCPEAASGKDKPAEARATGEERAAKASKADEIELDVKIVPNWKDSTIDVTTLVRAPAAKQSRSFSIRSPDASFFKMKEARDSRGPIKTHEEAQKGRVTVTLERASEGELSLQYTALTYVAQGKLPWMLSDPDRLEISGEALLLPDTARDAPITATLKVDIEPYGTTESGASVSGVSTSFGVGLSGQKPVSTTARELEGACIVAGRMGTAVFDAYEGHDEAAGFGYTTFDPRPVAADTAAFRTAAGEFFGERGGLPQTFLIVPEPRPVGSFVAARRTRGVLLHVGPGEPWSGPLRISTAVEVLHAWVGERLWIGPEEPARAAEGMWFEGGVTRQLARDLLFRFGLLTPSEVEAEVNGLEAVVATSPHASKSNAELAAHIDDPGVTTYLVARGALYALRVDAGIRARSGGKRGLPEVLRELYTKAKEKRGPLPVSAWIDKVVAEVGAGESKAFADIIERGGKLDVPADALGQCFRKETRKFVKYDLGFDEAATRAKNPPTLSGLRKGGPADLAGLKEGDVLVEARTTFGRSDIPVVVAVKRGDQEITAKYEPKGPAATGRGWSRRKDVPDENCTK